MRHWTTSAAPKPLKRGLGHLMKDTASTERRTDAQLEQNKERNRIKSRRGEKKFDGV